MIKLIMNFVNGLAFGVTQLIPGVSGGTLAIIMGFYDELIDTINNFRKDYKKSFKFALPFVGGIGIGIIAFSWLIEQLLQNFSLPAYFFFVGLIAGIAPAVFGKIKPLGERLGIKSVILIIVPIAALAAVSFIGEGSGEDVSRNITPLYMLFLFVSGALAAAGLLIPGVSGSFILILMGVYPVAIGALSNVSGWLRNITDMSLFIEIAVIAAPIGLGIIVGGLLTARLLGRLLEKHGAVIYSIILGLIIGSVFVLVRRDEVYVSGVGMPMVVSAVIACVAGAAISFILGKKRF